jgi:hypothetical protein
MKKVKFLTILSLTAVMLAMMTMPAMAATYEINQLHTWGVTLDDSATEVIYSHDYKTLANSDWIPDSSTADYVVEDNIDRITYPTITPPPVGKYGGLHIIGTGSSNTPYLEPLLKGHGGVVPPSGAPQTAPSRETNDIEAFYFDSDATNAYFAIVVSKPVSEMGDLALDLDTTSGYEYGIILQTRDSSFTEGDVCSGNIVWSNPSDFPNEGPYRVLSADNTHSVATVSIVDSRVSDYGSTNHVIEISVPRSALGNPSLSNLHATTSCGNDFVELKNVNWEIPEFTTIAIPVCMILGLFYFFRRKRQNE